MKLVYLGVVVLLIGGFIMGGLTYGGSGDIDSRKGDSLYPSFSESPYDDVYEIETWQGDNNVLLTTRTLPTVEGNYLKIENYWWSEWDEEGNEEWLRYANDYYYILYPIGDTVIQIIHIPDENNTAHIVHYGYERK